MITTDSDVRKGFTLIELLVVVSIIALLVSNLVPALRDARLQARKVVCLSNMRQIGIGIELFVAESTDGKYPQQGPPGTWSTAEERKGHWWQDVLPYIDSEWDAPTSDTESVGHCPNHTEYLPEKPYSYRGNWWMITNAGGGALVPREEAIRASSVKSPSQKLLVYEVHDSSTFPITGAWWNGGWLKLRWPEGVGTVGLETHGRVSNFLFCDTHVDSVDSETLMDEKAHWYHRGINWRDP